MRITGAQLTIKTLERMGVEIIAGIPGGANLPLYDALGESPIRHILARHEQGAGFIAQGQARITGRAGVCLATSGPGATNLITAVADAYQDSIPLIAISGQVSRSLMGKHSFQEADIISMIRPITKERFFIEDIKTLEDCIFKAFQIAEEGRPGPVWIDIPKDIQLEEIEWEQNNHSGPRGKIYPIFQGEKIKEAARLLEDAKRPFLIIGGGAIRSKADSLIQQLSKTQDMPAAATLMGLGAFPYFDPYYLGMLGMHGARYTNLLLAEADLILVLGARLNDRVTGKIDGFAPKAKVMQIDLDPSQLGKSRAADLAINADISEFLRAWLPSLGKRERSGWMSRVNELKARYPFYDQENSDFFAPSNLMRSLGEILPADGIITTDVGQHQMWTAQFYPFLKPGHFLTSGGFGTMGFGLPVAVGAALAAPQKEIICVSGDGSLLMNMQELITLKELNLNVKILLFDNGALGMVRQQQELFFGGRKTASEFEAGPDFPLLAKAMGLKAMDLEKAEQPKEELRDFMHGRGPGLIRIPMARERQVFPIVPPGKANTQMLFEAGQ